MEEPAVLQVVLDPTGPQLDGALIEPDALQQRLAEGVVLELTVAPEVTWTHVAELRELALDSGATEVLLLSEPTEPPEEEPTAELNRQELRKLKPKYSRLPPDPYANVIDTAYTLERGEFRLGLAELSYGLHDRVQLGISPEMLAFGTITGSLKANMLREGRHDFGILAACMFIPVSELLEGLDLVEQDIVDDAVALTLGARNSFIINQHWSMHASLNYRLLHATGSYDLSNLSAFLAPSDGADETGEGEDEKIILFPKIRADTIELFLRTDVRLNRRDTLFLATGFAPYSKVRGGVTMEDVELDDDLVIEGFPLDLELMLSNGGWLHPKLSFMVVGGWMFTWQHWELELGGGYSAVPYTWLLAAVDVAYRFGGQSRAETRAQKRVWKQKRRELD